MHELSHPCPPKLPLQDTTFVDPVSKVWPMGYAWSSFLAQSCMLAVCHAAGLTDKICMSTDLPLPKSVTESLGSATDDICHSATRGKAHAQDIGDRIDRAFKRVGLRSHQDKRVTGVVNGTCIGVDVSCWQYFGASTLWSINAKIDEVASRVVRTCSCRSCSCAWCLPVVPSSGETLVVRLLTELRVCQMDTTKNAANSTRKCARRIVFMSVSGSALAPLWKVDLQRPWSSTVFATDASDAFGFGISAATVNPNQVRRLGRTCADHQTMAVLNSDANDTPMKERPFSPCFFSLAQERIPPSCFVLSQVS